MVLSFISDAIKNVKPEQSSLPKDGGAQPRQSLPKASGAECGQSLPRVGGAQPGQSLSKAGVAQPGQSLPKAGVAQPGESSRGVERDFMEKVQNNMYAPLSSDSDEDTDSDGSDTVGKIYWLY